jgi:hypothetical protein
MVASWIAPSMIAALAWAGGTEAQQMFVYPQRGQTPEQQQRDRFECHQWAVQQSGFDPTAPHTAQASPPSQPPPGARGGPSPLRGAARGAAVGAAGGAIAGEAGTGAAVGAATGALFGGMRKADQHAQQQQQAQAAQQQAAAQGPSAYNRALGACLQGRGYTVQ